MQQELKMVFNFILKLFIGFHALTTFYIDLQKYESWKLNIIHTNDMHSRFDEISSNGIQCTSSEKLQKKCYGGFARIATLIRQAKNNTNMATLYFDAGDIFQGTPWFTVYNWTIASKFLNILKPDAFSLGNHEFDNGLEGLIPFINAAEFPIVSANLNLTNEPKLTASIKKSVIINVDNHRIGVVGYLTPETKKISNTDRVDFSDEIESVRQEVKKLVAENVTILIALGHSGFEIDKKIAAEIEDLDLVIGGHSHTFLYSGSAPDNEIAENLYPTVVVQKNGRKVYVVQAFTMTKYLGNLSITLDRFGEITEIFGNPILVDNRIEKASDVVEILEELRPAIVNLTERTLGYSQIPLYHDWRECRMAECNFGNLVTDSMVEYNKMKFIQGPKGWTDAAIAIIGSGSIKLTINKTDNQPIIFGDLMTALPHPHVILKVEVPGKILHQMLEHSVNAIYPNKSNEDPSGRFLHFSGIKVFYDLNKPVNSRVIEAEILCPDCDTPKYNNIDENKIYTILTSDFLQSGGDNFEMLKNCKFVSTGTTVRESVEKYFQIHKIVNPKVEGRIKFAKH